MHGKQERREARIGVSASQLTAHYVPGYSEPKGLWARCAGLRRAGSDVGRVHPRTGGCHGGDRGCGQLDHEQADQGRHVQLKDLSASAKKSLRGARAARGPQGKSGRRVARGVGAPGAEGGRRPTPGTPGPTGDKGEPEPRYQRFHDPVRRDGQGRLGRALHRVDRDGGNPANSYLLSYSFRRLPPRISPTPTCSSEPAPSHRSENAARACTGNVAQGPRRRPARSASTSRRRPPQRDTPRGSGCARSPGPRQRPTATGLRTGSSTAGRSPRRCAPRELGLHRTEVPDRRDGGIHCACPPAGGTPLPLWATSGSASPDYERREPQHPHRNGTRHLRSVALRSENPCFAWNTGVLCGCRVGEMSHPDLGATPDTRPIELGEVWENPATLERAVVVEVPWVNDEGRLVAELTALPVRAWLVSTCIRRCMRASPSRRAS